MTTIEITPVSGTELHRHYAGQTSPQDCYVSLDCASGRLSAGHNPEIGNAVTAREYHGHIQAWSIPAMREEPANELLEEIAPIAERVVAGYTSEWDGSNRVAAFDEDAQAAIGEIAALCEAAERDAESTALRVWDAGEWLTASGNTSRAQVREELGITAETTDEELAAIETRVEEEAVDCAEVDALEGTRRFLRVLRDDARAED